MQIANAVESERERERGDLLNLGKVYLSECTEVWGRGEGSLGGLGRPTGSQAGAD